MPIDDPMADTLTQRALEAGSNPHPLLDLTELFGDLPQSSRFVEAVTKYLSQFYELGTRETLSQLL